MGLTKKESLFAELAGRNLNDCTKASKGCFRSLVQSQSFKDFLLAAADQVPNEISPILKEAISICDKAKAREHADKHARNEQEKGNRHSIYQNKKRKLSINQTYQSENRNQRSSEGQSSGQDGDDQQHQVQQDPERHQNAETQQGAGLTPQDDRILQDEDAEQGSQLEGEEEPPPYTELEDQSPHADGSPLVLEEAMTPDEVEAGLLQTDPEIVKTILKEWKLTSPYEYKQNKELDEVLFICRQLSRQTGGVSLLEHLAERPESSPNKDLELPATWKIDKSDKLLAAINELTGKGIHTKIHKAFAQIRLKDFTDQESGGTVARLLSDNKVHLSDHLNYLRQLVSKQYPRVMGKAKEKIVNEHVRAYHAGNRWKKIAKAFGNTAIVMVFITTVTYSLLC